MLMRSQCTPLLAAVLVTTLLTSCAQKAEDAASPAATKGKIGMTCMDLTNPFFELIADIMEEEAGKHGYTLVRLSGELDPAKQNNQLADFAAQGCVAIFLNPVDSNAAGAGVKKAHEAGVPVFTFDVEVTAPDAKDLIVSHIGSDNYQGGLLAGESMMKVTGDKGKIALITYPEVTSAKQRRDGFMDYLKEHNSKLEVVAELSGKGARDQGYNVATDLLQAQPDLVGIFAVNDPSALGTYEAVAKAGKQDQITIIGFDASPSGKQAVFEKKLYDTPQQFPRKMAQGTVDAFIKYMNGEEVPKTTFIPCSHYYYDNSVNDERRKEW